MGRFVAEGALVCGEVEGVDGAVGEGGGGVGGAGFGS